jgi:hypothetical protein
MQSWLRTQTFALIPLLLIPFLSIGSAWAQSQPTPPCTLGVAHTTGYGVAPGRKGAPPFLATVKTTYEQRLADGNGIHGTVLGHEARDSAGRIRNEVAAGCERGADGQWHTRLSVNVFDPGARASLFWEVDTNPQKTVRHVVAPLPVGPPRRQTEEELAEQAWRMKAGERERPHQETKTEKLGTTTVNGVLAEGTRTTRTIPPGEEGNDLPLVLVTEHWRSTDLGIEVKAIEDDPRRGRTTFELEDISLSEPDAGLFKPPPGYKVQEVLPPVQVALSN